MARDFKTIGVVGLGTMGAGITEVFARNGYAVVGVEVDDDGVTRGRQHLEHSTARAVARGKLSETDEKELHDRVSFATSLEELKDADLVVEAVVESVEIKKQIFKQLDGDRLAGRDPRDQHLLAVGHRDLVGHLPPRPRHRHALLQPGAGPGLRGDRADRRDRARGARGRRGARAGARARTPWCAATRPASSPTRCCSATSTTRSRCTRTATPPARTSTRRCASAVATRWVRSPCST